jgi:hypothetical protein
VAPREKFIVAKHQIGMLAAERDFRSGQVVEISAKPASRQLTQASPGRGRRRPEYHDTIFDRGSHALLVRGDDLEPEDLTSEEDMVRVAELDGGPQAHIDAVSAIERRQKRAPERQVEARMPGRKLRIVDPNVTVATADIDLIVRQPVHGVILPVGQHRDQTSKGSRWASGGPASTLLGPRVGGSRRRCLRQPSGRKASPTSTTGDGAIPIFESTTSTPRHRARVLPWSDCVPGKALVTGERSPHLPRTHPKLMPPPIHPDLAPPPCYPLRRVLARSRRLTSSPAAVNRGGFDVAPTAAVFLQVLLTIAGNGGCGPMVERAPFPARPDSVRSADLLGPYDGKVIDADSERPIAGALVAGSWAFERGIGVEGPLDAEEVVVQTGADGRYAIPRLSRLPTGLSSRVRRFTVIVYRRSYVGWRSDRRFPDKQIRRDFSQRNNLVRLERWQTQFAHSQHLLFLGGGAKVRQAASWEAEQARLDLEGEQSGRLAAGGSSSAGGTVAAMLDIAGLLTDDEIRGVTGYVGTFDAGRLSDLPTTEFYDSRHFKAKGHAESYDVGLRVWRLGAAAAEVQYGQLQRELPKPTITDEIGDASFVARAGQIQGLVFLVRERGVVVSLTCGADQCSDATQIRTLGKLVESRLPDLPAAGPSTPPVPSLNESPPREGDEEHP